METEDKEIICKECGFVFVWTKGEQDFFVEKGLTNTPSRCPVCRKKKKVRHTFTNNYNITCAACGKKSTSPFKPEQPKKVLCQECFLAQEKEQAD